MTLDKLFQHGAEAAEHLFNRQGQLRPMWVGINEKGSHIPLVVPDMDDKDKTAETIRKFLRDQKIVRYVSMLECWMYQGDKMPPEIAAGISLEHNPDRREGIFVCAEDKDGNTISGRFFILRPEHGKPKLSPLKIDKVDNVEGRFAKMFD